MERLNTELERALTAVLECDEVPNRPVLDADKAMAGALQGLVDLGYLKLVNVPTEGLVGLTHYELTVAGRSYFPTLERDRREHRGEMWGNRKFQIIMSAATLILSALLSYFVSANTAVDAINDSAIEQVTQLLREYADNQDLSKQPK